MELTAAQRIAQRFVGLPLEQRRQILAKMQATGQSFRLLPIMPTRQGLARIPLSFAQQRLLFLWQLEPDNAFYNVPMAVRLNGALDPERLQQALTALVQRHEALRTRLVAVDGEFHQEVLDQGDVQLEVQAFAAGQDAAQLEAAVRDDLARPFDLLHGPLLRMRLLQLGDDQHVLTVCMHHIVSDGWSSELLVREFVALYTALGEGREAPLAPLPIQYADYAIWQRAWLEAGEAERQLQYWRTQLGDEQPVLSLPLDRPRPAQPSYRGAVLEVKLPAALSEALRGRARQGGHTLFTLMLAAVAVVLSRYSGQADVRIGAPNAGRNRQELEGLIGFFINTQVLRVQVDERQTFAELLAQLKEVIAGAQSHQELPFEHLVDALLPERNLAHNPLFQFKINQHVGGGQPARTHVGALSLAPFPLGNEEARFDLAFDFSDRPDGIEGYFTYATDLFDATTVERLAEALRRTLQRLAEGDTQRLCAQPEPAAIVPVAHLAEADQALAARDLITLWQANRAGQGGVRAGEQRLERAQLDADSDRLAAYLRQQGIGAGHIVALCQPRSIEWVTALLAVLKTGAAYLPLDPQQPVERLQQLLHDSAAVALIHPAEDTRFSAGDGPPRIVYDPRQWQDCAAQAQPIAISPEQPAYLIYTSGSTGQPKGVLVSHAALASYVQALLERLALPADASLAMVSTPAADLGHTVLFGALLSGRELHLLPAKLAFDPDGFAAYMAEHQVGVVKLVPSHLQGLLQASRAADVLPAQALILGGEACSWALFEQVRALRPACRVINHYGPTETTVGVLTHEAVDCTGDCRTVPIGRPLAHAVCAVLDDWLNPVAEQVSGELYLGGQGLARGYLNRPGLTAERFVPGAGGTRLYRSGDRARLSREGLVEFLARADDQVKIRGYRVEPGEVGQLLASLPGVREAVVQALALDSDEQRLHLVAWCVVEAGIEAAELQRQLQARLPDYLVPAHLLLLERLPLTANGKLDKRALPVPGAVSRGYVAPVGEVEQTLAEVWADVLKLERVGSTDNFFELGGDSILSLQIIARAKRRGLRITPKQLFEKQTIAQLAPVAKPLAAKPAAVAPTVPMGPVTTALLPIQQRFFTLDIPQRQHWNQSLLLTPHTALDPTVLQQALHDVLAQHEALRTRFVEHAEGWQGQVQPLDDTTPFSQQRLHSLAELESAGQALQASLDLSQGPLLRAALFELPDAQQRLLLVIHHLVVDGVSWRVLLEDLQTAYRQRLQGTVVDLGGRCTAPGRWAERLQGYAAGAASAQRDYWLEVQHAEADLPQDQPNAALSRRHAGHVHTRLGREHTAQLLKQAPAAYRTQINDLLLTALAQVLCQWSGQAQVKVALEGHGREDLFDDLDLSRSVGWFTSLFPVCLRPSTDLGASIKAIKEQLREVPDKGLGYGVLRYLGEAELRQRLGQGSEARVTFNYLGQFDGSFSASEGALFSPAREAAGSTQADDAPLANWLSISGQVYDGELVLEWTFSHAMYRSETLERLAQAYRHALEALVEHCCDAAQGGVTPSDFPLAGLNQVQLDHLPLPAAQIADVYPLSPMQQGMLFHSLYAQGSGQYVNQLRIDIDHLDGARFREAWQATLAAHDILRSGFVWQGDLQQAVQVVHKHVQVPLREFDWRGKPDLPAAVQQLSDAEHAQPFDLGEAPLLRLALVRSADQRHHLIYTNHHILMDGWSTSRLLAEVLQRYAGQPPAAPTGRYRDYIAWLQRQDAAASETFWRAQVAELAAPTRLAEALAGNGFALGAGQGEHRQVFDGPQSATIEAFARANRVTVNTLVQSAWLLLLQRYTGQASVCLGATVAGRPTELAGVEEQIGLFINTLPVIGTPRAEQTVGQWIAEVQARNLALREHEHTPLFDVQRWAHSGSDSLFDSLLVFENYPVAEALRQSASSGLAFGPVAVQEQTHYPLTLVVELGATLSVQYSHDRARVAERAVQQLAEHFAQLLLALVADAQACLGTLALQDPERQAQALEAWNPALRDVPVDRCLHTLIEAQVAATPQATALVCGQQRLSYAELNRHANRLAHHLRSLGVGPDVLVGLAVERSLEMVVGLLAILKAGGAYVPLDPDSPAERLAYLLDDSGIAVLLTQSHLQARLPVGPRVQTVLFEAVEALAGLDETNPPCATTPDNLAYMIYTSGSTGKPKGTLLAHRNVVRLFAATEHWFGFGARDVWSVFHSYAFDFSVWELYGALLYGGKAVIVPKDVARSPEDFHALLLREQVTVLNQTPSAFKPLMAVACEAAQPLALRHVIFGGEALEVSSLKPWFDTFGDAQPQLTNMYGITETTVHVSYRPIRLSDVQNGLSSPIGEAIPDLAWYLLDGALNPAVPGTQGELMIARAGLARGYHGRPGLTAERFVPNPFDAEGGRLYRSGDLACARHDGVIEYAGRIDHQVKIRGFRIELGEIEARLHVQPGVRQVAVLAQDGPAGKQLVAYVVPNEVAAIEDGEAQAQWRDTLRAALKASLPEHMVPAHLLFLAALPLTGNGKLDRKALPLPDAGLLQGRYAAPQSELECQVAAVWAEVLEVERVGLHDHFFELGGHSLLATTAVMRIRERTGAAVELKDLFEHATLGDFCQHVQGQTAHVDPLQDQLAKSLAALKRLTTEEIDELTS
ncbi:amino acid adenylation domain-containing protein [Pseudomonas sp. MLB6B]